MIKERIDGYMNMTAHQIAQDDRRGQCNWYKPQ